MRKKTDFSYINVAELEALLKGMNLVVKLGLKKIDLVKDWATVQEWVSHVLSGYERVKTKGAEDIIIKRRLGVISALMDEL